MKRLNIVQHFPCAIYVNNQKIKLLIKTFFAWEFVSISFRLQLTSYMQAKIQICLFFNYIFQILGIKYQD